MRDLFPAHPPPPFHRSMALVVAPVQAPHICSSYHLSPWGVPSFVDEGRRCHLTPITGTLARSATPREGTWVYLLLCVVLWLWLCYGGFAQIGPKYGDGLWLPGYECYVRAGRGARGIGHTNGDRSGRMLPWSSLEDVEEPTITMTPRRRDTINVSLRKARPSATGIVFSLCVYSTHPMRLKDP